MRTYTFFNVFKWSSPENTSDTDLVCDEFHVWNERPKLVIWVSSVNASYHVLPSRLMLQQRVFTCWQWVNFRTGQWCKHCVSTEHKQLLGANLSTAEVYQISSRKALDLGDARPGYSKIKMSWLDDNQIVVHFPNRISCSKDSAGMITSHQIPSYSLHQAAKYQQRYSWSNVNSELKALPKLGMRSAWELPTFAGRQ